MRMTSKINFLLDSLRSLENATQTAFYQTHPDCRVGSVIDGICKDFAPMCKATFYNWLKEYATNGQFKRDERGLWAENFIAHNEDLKRTMTDWLLKQKEIDIDFSWDYVNNILLKDFPVGRICTSSGLCRPVTRMTVISWVKLCGGALKTRMRGYYNDTHERWDNLFYRALFCLLVEFIEYRQPRFGTVCVLCVLSLRCASNISLPSTRWVCIPHEHKLQLESEGDWIPDELAVRVPVNDVGEFPPGVGVQEYKDIKRTNPSTNAWLVMFIINIINVHTYMH